MSTATDVRGLKRICSNCSVRFYDMNKRPIVCPSCETEFTGDIKVKSRRGRAAATSKDEGQVSKKSAKDVANDDTTDNEDDTDTDVEIISIDDVEEDGKDDKDEDDIDLGDVDVDLGDEDDADDIDAGIDDLDDDLENDIDLKVAKPSND